MATVSVCFALFSQKLSNVKFDRAVVGQILACVAGCCISCITGMVEWFNRYAYIEIALYGKPYVSLNTLGRDWLPDRRFLIRLSFPPFSILHLDSCSAGCLGTYERPWNRCFGK